MGFFQFPQSLGVALQPLPAYSPDFMPVEHLWHWPREDLTYHTCYDQVAELITQFEQGYPFRYDRAFQ